MSHASLLVVTRTHPLLDALTEILLPYHEYETTGIERYVEWVDEQVDDGVLGTRTDQIRLLLAAHIATVMANGGISSIAAPGPVSSESVDGVSRSYAVTSSDDGDDLSATSYGRRAMLLMRSSATARLPRAY